MIFSACSVLAFAEGEEEVTTYTVTFLNDDGTTIEVRTGLASGAKIKAPEDPTKEADENYTYIFKYWAVYKDGVLDESQHYYPSAIPKVTEDATYMAVYSAQEVKEILTFWELVQSFFARLNALFEYFAKIFFNSDK